MKLHGFCGGFLVLVCTGCCGAGLDVVWFDGHEANDPNFERALGRKPDFLKILNSAYVTYDVKWWAPWHMFSNASPDWAFELLAPPEWVEEQKRLIPLRKADPKEQWAGFTWATDSRTAWFCPDREHFDSYDEYLPSIPYRKLFVDRIIREDGLLHVFYEKR